MTTPTPINSTPIKTRNQPIISFFTRSGKLNITITFDASYQGESGGQPRYGEDPNARVEDDRGAVDFLTKLPYVDENRIGVLGICAGGGYATSAAMTERRIKAVGLSVPVNGGNENRAAGQKATIETLESIAKQRTVEARGSEPMILPWIPDEYKDSEDIDLREAYLYYRTPRGQNPNWQNKMLFTSLDAVMAYDAFYLSEMLLTQPLQVIVGSTKGAFGSNRDGHEIYKRAASTEKDIVVLEGASHMTYTIIQNTLIKRLINSPHSTLRIWINNDRLC